MYPFAVPESIGDAQAIADVTSYIQKLPMNPDHGKGEWAEDSPEFRNGRQLYINGCIKCHGQYGRGSEEKFYPRLDGQHYNYMLRQLIWIRDGKRRNANEHMVEQIKRFNYKELQMVSNYVSRMPVNKKDLAPSADWRNPDLY
ncbi:hypothetical protein MNBD_GAMMA26-893 [hydrothermal vent metagenome]|uniref:Cytochrome c domain-containing protein n=1 Tax=hydrothermal vent metagenome TaxID=652676 RepID=A0A3B1BAI5_9ZZZZ